MKNYIWTFNTAALASLNGAFSLEYHVPASKLKVAPDALVGSRIWLVVRDDSENFLYGFLSPSIIELYQEGKYKDDFLVRCEPFSSVRLLPRQESRAPWRLPFAGDEEIRECTDAEQSALLETLDKNQRVGFASPSRAVLDPVPRTAFPDLEHAVPDQLMSTLRTVAFGDASRSRSMPSSISALGGIALTILKSTHPHMDEADTVNLIAALDPLAKAEGSASLKSPEDLKRVLSWLPPVVDTFLEEIDPDKISPRIFVAKTPDSSLDWLDKTNDAEQAHERILKEIVLYLRNKGFKLYKTRSFDLFAEKDNIRFLCEIKSATAFNSVSQGEKGIIQLLRYSVALSGDSWKGVRFLLFLQHAGQSAAQNYLTKMTERVNAELWLYDEKTDWPRRIFNVHSEFLDVS